MTTVVHRGHDGRNLGHDLSGRTFGKLTVIRKTGGRSNGYVLWLARCACGSEVVRPSYRFIRSNLRSCGCAPGPIGRPRIPEDGAHINSVHGHIRTSARARRLDFDLSRRDVAELIVRDCTYCGVPPSIRPTHKNLSGPFAYNGIDRIDSSRGYIRGNVTACCPTCNIAKAQMTVDEFRSWIERAYNHMSSAP